MDFENGELLLFDKPYRWTSFDLVKKVRNLTRAKKVGHAGTLDPLATGLLIVCTGKKTKQIADYQLKEKEYTGVMFLGATTPGYDMEMAVDQTFPIDHLNNQMIFEATREFTGAIRQVPPGHSAVKVDGKRAYELARKGKEANIKSKEVEIRIFEISKIEMPLVFFRVVCSKGTYIRSLVNDFGKALGAGAYLQSLCRTRIGEFRLEDAYSIEDFQNSFIREASPRD